MAGCVGLLEGIHGSFLSLGWKGGLLGFPSTSSSNSEIGGWGRAFKRTFLVASVIERARIAPLKVFGCADNQALRWALSREYSDKLASLNGTAGANLLYMQSTSLIPRTISGADHCSDGLTKVLGRKKLTHLFRRFFNINGPAALAAAIHMSRHDEGCE